MKKFKNKNRQKRKYTRHNVPQTTYQFSPLLAGLVPTIILAVTFAVMLLQPQLSQPSINTPTFTLPVVLFNDILHPIQSLPTLITTSIQSLMTAFGFGLEQLLILLDPRPIFVSIDQGSTAVVSSASAVGVSLVDALAKAITNIWGAIAYAGVQIGNAVMSLLELLGGVFWFLVHGFVHIVLFLFNWFVSIVTAIANAILWFIHGIVRVILIPFQVIGAFWLMVKPYVDTLLYYCGLAVSDMGQGFSNLANLGSLLQK